MTAQVEQQDVIAPPDQLLADRQRIVAGPVPALEPQVVSPRREGDVLIGEAKGGWVRLDRFPLRLRHALGEKEGDRHVDKGQHQAKDANKTKGTPLRYPSDHASVSKTAPAY